MLIPFSAVIKSITGVTDEITSLKKPSAAGKLFIFIRKKIQKYQFFFGLCSLQYS